jgi:hypothetical protein
MSAWLIALYIPGVIAFLFWVRQFAPRNVA